MKKTEKEILENIYDLLANNSQYVEPDAIARDFETEVDFDNKTITLWGPEGEMKVTINVSFNKE